MQRVFTNNNLPRIDPLLDGQLRESAPALGEYLQRQNVALYEWWNKYTRLVQNGGWVDGTVLPPPATSITTSTYDYRTYAPTGLLNGNDIYDPVYPGISHYDVAASVLEIPSGSTTDHMSAISAYVQNNVAASSGVRNGVGFFMCGMGTVNDSVTWGVNTLLQDSATRATHSGTGRALIGAELDFNVMSTGTGVIGVSVGGNSLAQPTNANAYLINHLGTGYKWTGGLVSFAGTCDYFIVCDLAATAAANVNSQICLWRSRNASNTEVATQLKTVGGLFQVSSDGSAGETGFDFPTAGTRIRIDASNSTHASRFFFQDRGTNNGTIVASLPNGTGTAAGWRGYGNSDTTAALAYFDVAVVAGDRVRFMSNNLNSGTTLPIKIEIGSTALATFDTSNNVTVGPGSIATNATDGFLYIPSCAGAPSGTPTTKTGFIPLVYDSTNNILYAYSGGSWRTH
jgi:hypothetical protein